MTCGLGGSKALEMRISLIGAYNPQLFEATLTELILTQLTDVVPDL